MPQQALCGAIHANPNYQEQLFLHHYDVSPALDSGPRGGVSPFSVNGTVPGTVSSGQSVFGGFSYLNGSSNSVLSKFNPYLDPEGKPWFFECRIRTTTLAAAQVLMDGNTGSSNNTGPQIYIGTDGKIYLYSGTQATNYGGYGTGITTNTWYSVAVGWDGTTAYFFKDGVLLGSTTGFTNIWGTGLVLWNSAFLNQRLTGNADEARMHVGVCLHTATYTVETEAFE